MLVHLAGLFGAQPILSLFLVVGFGYAVGQINVFGFSLGIGAVLFVGLALGVLAPKAHISGPIGLIGLVMFLYGIGIVPQGPYAGTFGRGLGYLGSPMTQWLSNAWSGGVISAAQAAGSDPHAAVRAPPLKPGSVTSLYDSP